MLVGGQSNESVSKSGEVKVLQLCTPWLEVMHDILFDNTTLNKGGFILIMPFEILTLKFLTSKHLVDFYPDIAVAPS